MLFSSSKLKKTIKNGVFMIRFVNAPLFFSAETAERRLPRKDLYAVCKLECTQNYVRKCDYAFYHALVEVLIPDVLRPIPSE